MKKIKLFGVLLISGLISFTSCESVDEAQKTANIFYKAFNAQNTDLMDTLLDQTSVIDAGIKNDFYKVFQQHSSAFGKVTNHNRYAFVTNTKNGLTTVTLKFNCSTEKDKTVYEKLKFVKRGKNYKLYEYEYNIDKSVIDKEE
ncbi:MAG: hypothetical protein L3J56_11545 [Bacteroidales bacterium]|nr:hypothetical protein [Bacteroidales bacterium]